MWSSARPEWTTEAVEGLLVRRDWQRNAERVG